MHVYEWADELINSAPRYATGFTELLSPQPFLISSDAWHAYQARLPLIRSYQQITLQIFRAALRNELDPAILHWLINDTPISIGLGYHRRLEDRHFTLPVFMRTDEVRPGRIAEIQCPGSAWGELQLVFEYAEKMGFVGKEKSPADQFVAQLTNLLHETPVVHHLIDSASAPPGVRYFVEKTRPQVRYWSIDREVKVHDCNFIRSHSFFCICSDYAFQDRLSRMGKGVTYDLPPLTLFDSKAPLVLPFWSLTREAYPDAVRNLFPFTTPLLPTGIELPDGTLTIEEFSRLPKSGRTYYLKYSGANIAINWGSKAVYRLSNMGSGACLDFLRQCLSGYADGQVWLLQKEEYQEDEIAYLTRDGAQHSQSMRAKFSGYYGPDGCIGIMAWHRPHFKVHGQDESVLSYVLADTEASIPA